VEYTKH
nr:Chain F, VAL-GLU-TYR-THR-LYS-HIS [Flavobacterium johnsoniae]